MLTVERVCTTRPSLNHLLDVQRLANQHAFGRGNTCSSTIQDTDWLVMAHMMRANTYFQGALRNSPQNP